MKKYWLTLKAFVVLAFIISSCGNKNDHNKKTIEEIHRACSDSKIFCISGEEGWNYIAVDKDNNVKVFFWSSGDLQEKEISRIQ